VARQNIPQLSALGCATLFGPGRAAAVKACDAGYTGPVFGRNKKTADETTEPEAQNEAAEQQTKRTPQPKGEPTPTRREREAARKRPLVPDDRKAARLAQREHLRQLRQKQRVAMETGDEKYLPPRDRGPQRRFVRDWVDARFGVGEWMLLLVLAFLFISFVLTDEARLVMSQVLWLFVLAVIVECWWVARRVRKQLEAKFGEVEKGVRFYAAMRSLQIRRLRLPKPMVSRGEFPS